jgi:outer membrane biogenesis lipoprotein LolB
MFKSKFWYLILVVLVLASFALAACQPTAEQPTAEEPAAGVWPLCLIFTALSIQKLRL